jgi:hypothetical protein
MQEQIVLHVNDIVHLNSGSPALKVVSTKGIETEVEWLNDLNGLERIVLPTVCFRRAVSN